MPIHTVEAQTAIEAWRLGVDRLLKESGQVNNLVTTINNPCIEVPAWLLDHSPDNFKAGGDDARDVANTLFPAKIAKRAANRAELYAQYIRRHDRTKRWLRGRHAWGTYFERLIRFPPDNVNQLERVITKLNTWPMRNTTGLVFHLSSPSIDAPRTRGGPCWHYGELLWNPDRTLDLVVVYRNHDFFNKVLGNFVGLGRLLQFICTEGGKQPGRLVCHSVHAYFDSSQQQMRALAA